MQILIDTHLFIWYILDIDQINTTVRDLINNRDNQILLSTVSVWEIAIKQSIGKLSFSSPIKNFIEQQLVLNDFQKIKSSNHILNNTITLRVGRPYPYNIGEFISWCSLNDFNLLDIRLDHIDVITTLPLHHRDPFDRLLIAQAMVEKIPIISVDAAFDAYSIMRLW